MVSVYTGKKYLSVQEALVGSLQASSLDDNYNWNDPCPLHGDHARPIKRQRLLQEPQVLLLHMTTYVAGKAVDDFEVNQALILGSGSLWLAVALFLFFVCTNEMVRRERTSSQGVLPHEVGGGWLAGGGGIFPS